MAVNNHKEGFKWGMLTTAFLSIVFMYVSYVGYSVVTVAIMDEIGLDYTQAGMLASMTSITGGLAVLFAWIVVSKFGPKKICVFAMAFCAIGLFLFGQADTYPILLLSRGIQGIGVCLLFVGPYTFANNWFSGSKNAGVCNGVLMAGDGAGTAFGMYIYALVLVAVGWRNGSTIGAIFLIVIVIILAIVMKDPPIYGAPDKGGLSDTIPLKRYLKVIRHRNVIAPGCFLIGLWGLFGVACYWVPTILQEDAGWSVTTSGAVGALYSFIGIISSIGVGLISDSLGKRRVLVIICGIAMTIAFAICAVAVASDSFVLLAVMFSIGGLASYAGMPLAYALSSSTVRPKEVSAAFGFIQFMGLFGGALIYPVMLGYIKDVTGSYIIGFIGIAISIFLLNVVGAFFLKDVKPGTEGDLQKDE